MTFPQERGRSPVRDHPAAPLREVAVHGSAAHAILPTAHEGDGPLQTATGEAASQQGVGEPGDPSVCYKNPSVCLLAVC